jgi:hypothetical protein
MESKQQFTRSVKARLAKSNSNRVKKKLGKRKKKVATVSRWLCVVDIISTFLAKVLGEIAKKMLGL